MLLDHNEKYSYYIFRQVTVSCLFCQYIIEGFIINRFSGGGQSNRLFIILAIALLGLICLGLLGLGGVLYLSQSNQEQAAVTPEVPTPIPPTLTPTSTATATPTETPLPTPTSTPVINNENEPTTEPEVIDTPTTDPNATATNTPVIPPTDTATPEPSATPTLSPEEMPSSGGVLSTTNGSSALGWIGGGVLVILIIYGIFNKGWAAYFSQK